ncbi:hypothetical protein [Cupriavidus consociatus]|uniref:hypothetical protein n=1 Tax=Cupriavidus consociatus TaxID=2821357 RepID=UPI001AEADC0E|nr:MULTISPECIES: hypothetical protein [unclassified Cupriavidus]MBP0625263.1 hypothetical protein [Cupriavidus sp. LEh25]MDK2661997.1 hypothetical protein [Cupriavidus sp. LEh21]
MKLSSQSTMVASLNKAKSMPIAHILLRFQSRGLCVQRRIDLRSSASSWRAKAAEQRLADRKTGAHVWQMTFTTEAMSLRRHYRH